MRVFASRLGIGVRNEAEFDSGGGIRFWVPFCCSGMLCGRNARETRASCSVLRRELAFFFLKFASFLSALDFNLRV